MKNVYCILLLVFVLLTGCSQQKKTDSTFVTDDSTAITVTVDVPNYPALPYDSVIDDISFVRLETNDDCLIGEVSQLLCTDSLIFVVDHDSKKIFTFNRAGKFLYPIGGIGQGPGELYGSRLCNISLTSSGDELVVFDFGKICYFSLGGEFLREERVRWDCKELRLLQNGMYCSYTVFGYAGEEGNPMLSVFEGVDKFKYGAFPTHYRDNKFTFGPKSALDKFGDAVYFCDPFKSTIYEVTPEGAKKRFYVDILGIEKLKFDENMDDNLFNVWREKSIYCEDFIVLKDKAVFEMRMLQCNTSPFVIYSFKTGKTYCCDAGNIRNPMFVFRMEPQARDGESTLVLTQDANDILDRKEWLRNYKGVDMEVFAKLYGGYTEESNPVVFFFHVKEDL